jgi:hypothetical protein
MTKLRQWMELQALAPVTLSVYTRCARRFLEHVGKPLGAVTARDVEQYLLELARKDRSPRNARRYRPRDSVKTPAEDSLAWPPLRRLHLGLARRGSPRAGPATLAAHSRLLQLDVFQVSTPS